MVIKMSYRKNIELLIKSKNKEANGEYILVYCNEFKFDINESYKIETDIIMNRSKIIFNQQVDYNYLFSSLINLGGKIYEAIVNESDFDNIIISVENFSTMIKQYELKNNEPILKLIIDFIKNFGYPYKIKKD